MSRAVFAIIGKLPGQKTFPTCLSTSSARCGLANYTSQDPHKPRQPIICHHKQMHSLIRSLGPLPTLSGNMFPFCYLRIVRVQRMGCSTQSPHTFSVRFWKLTAVPLSCATDWPGRLMLRDLKLTSVSFCARRSFFPTLLLTRLKSTPTPGFLPFFPPPPGLPPGFPMIQQGPCKRQVWHRATPRHQDRCIASRRLSFPTKRVAASATSQRVFSFLLLSDSVNAEAHPDLSCADKH